MYGQLPSQIAVLTLKQDKASGKLTLVKYHNVDTSGVHGLWITCGASLSPWNTHLSSEEYEPDPWNTSAAAVAQFQGFSTRLFGNAATANPYHYGHLPEVTVKPDGTGSIVSTLPRPHLARAGAGDASERTVLMATTPPTAACSCSSPTPRATCRPARSTWRAGRPPHHPTAAPAR